MLLGLFLPFTWYFYDMQNSPQMWWALRRYTYVLLPTIYLSFCFFILDLKNRKLQAAIMFASLILMLNITLRVDQPREMIGLDSYAQEFSETYPAQDYVILYEDDLHYSISSILSYGAYDFALVTNDTMVANAASATDKSILYFTDNKYVDPHLANTDSSWFFSMDYSRMVENYDQLPYQHSPENVLFEIYEIL